MAKNQKKKETIVNKIKDNKKELIFMFGGFAVGIILMLILWPSRIATLADGTQEVASVNNKSFTADDLYTELKSSGGLDALINLIDQYILYEKYDLDDEAAEFADEQSEQIYTTYETYYGYTKDQFLTANGFEDEEEFLKYLRDEYYYQNYYDEYTETLIDEDDISDYYKDEVFGDKDIYLFSASSEDDLEGVLNYLEKGKTYDQITDKYTSVTANSYEVVTFKDSSTYSANVIEELTTLSAGEYSEIVEDTTYGYFIVYVVSEEDKADLEDIREDIIEILVDDLQSEDSNIYYQAFIALRKEYGLTFSDTGLQSEYEELVSQYE